MFLKKSTFRKNGSLYSYYKIVSTYKDEQGKNRHRTVKYVGRLSDEEAERLRGELRDLKKRRRHQAGQPEQPERAASFPFPAAALVPLEIQQLTYGPGSQKEWNVTEADMLLIVRDGAGELYMNGRKQELVYGTVLFCPAGSGMYLFNDGGRPLQLDRITFDMLARRGSTGRESQGVYQSVPAAFPVHEPIKLHTPSRVLQLSGAMRKLALQIGTPDLVQLHRLFYELLHIILLNQATASPDEPVQMIERTAAYMRAHYREDMTRDQMAERLGVSHEHFSRLFKKETGFSFTDYLVRLRIEKSKELLQVSSAGLQEIAETVGFKSEYYFSRKFKQVMGVSPTVYTQQPKSYISLDPGITSSFLTLGVVPRAGFLEPWMAPHYEAVLADSGFVRLDGWNSESAQLVREVRPDFLFCVQGSGHAAELQEMGPVLQIPLEELNWREQLRLIGDSVRHPDAVEAWLKRFDQSAAEAREQLAAVMRPHETVAIVKVVSGKLYLYGNLRSMGGPLIYDCLGLTPPPKVQEQIIGARRLNQQITLHELFACGADHIFVIDYHSSWPDQPSPLQNRKEWKELPAFIRGRVYEVSPQVFYGFDPLSLSLQLTEAIRRLSSHL